MKEVLLNLAPINSNINGIYYTIDTYESALISFINNNLNAIPIHDGYTNNYISAFIKQINIKDKTAIIQYNDVDCSYLSESSNDYIIGFKLEAKKSKINIYDIVSVDYAVLIPKDNLDISTYKPKTYNVITLCGSTKFKKEFNDVQKQLTLKGNIVISVGCFGHSGDNISKEDKYLLDDMHKRKILMANAIYVIDKNNYIGESTKSEIEFAKANNIKVIYYSKDESLVTCQEYHPDNNEIFCKGNNYEKCKSCDIYI